MALQPYRTKVSVEEYLAIDRESVDVRYEYIYEQTILPEDAEE